MLVQPRVNSITSIVTHTDEKVIQHWAHTETNDSEVIQDYIIDLAKAIKAQDRPKYEL